MVHQHINGGNGKMKRRSTKKIIIVVPLLISVVVMGLLVSMSKIDKQTEKATTLFKATISDISVTNTGKRTFVEIYTKEYKTVLYIANSVCKHIEIDEIKSLKKGQIVNFRIENAKVEQMNQVEFINIVSLGTDFEECFSLEDYNEYIFESAIPSRVIGVVISSASLIVSIIFCWKTKKKTKT